MYSQSVSSASGQLMELTRNFYGSLEAMRNIAGPVGYGPTGFIAKERVIKAYNELADSSKDIHLRLGTLENVNVTRVTPLARDSLEETLALAGFQVREKNLEKLWDYLKESGYSLILHKGMLIVGNTFYAGQDTKSGNKHMYTAKFSILDVKGDQTVLGYYDGEFDLPITGPYKTFEFMEILKDVNLIEVASKRYSQIRLKSALVAQQIAPQKPLNSYIKKNPNVDVYRDLKDRQLLGTLRKAFPNREITMDTVSMVKSSIDALDKMKNGDKSLTESERKECLETLESFSLISRESY